MQNNTFLQKSINIYQKKQLRFQIIYLPLQPQNEDFEHLSYN